jgi:hypothetical protein
MKMLVFSLLSQADDYLINRPICILFPDTLYKTITFFESCVTNIVIDARRWYQFTPNFDLYIPTVNEVTSGVQPAGAVSPEAPCQLFAPWSAHTYEYNHTSIIYWRHKSPTGDLIRPHQRNGGIHQSNRDSWSCIGSFHGTRSCRLLHEWVL